MKRNVLARRAASAALAACMMFSLSAPALAASTDALLQQSTAAKSAVSVLDEENGTEVETEYQMNLKYGSITVYIGLLPENGKRPIHDEKATALLLSEKHRGRYVRRGGSEVRFQDC